MSLESLRAQNALLRTRVRELERELYFLTGGDGDGGIVGDGDGGVGGKGGGEAPGSRVALAAALRARETQLEAVLLAADSAKTAFQTKSRALELGPMFGRAGRSILAAEAARPRPQKVTKK